MPDRSNVGLPHPLLSAREELLSFDANMSLFPQYHHVNRHENDGSKRMKLKNASRAIPLPTKDYLTKSGQSISLQTPSALPVHPPIEPKAMRVAQASQ